MCASLLTATNAPEAGRRPRDDELDLFGLTHPGKVRKDNQDHFLLCTVHPQVVVHGTSLPNPEQLPLRGERLATIFLVADGVGSSRAGGEASQVAVEAITRYVSSTLRCYHTAGSAEEGRFYAALKAAALEAHEAVRSEAAQQPEAKRMATTLTVAIAVWPWVYVVQVGDSRCYYYWDGVLRQVTRDQTMAQDLVDRGALPADRVSTSPFTNVLISSIGGEEATPEVSRFDVSRPGTVLLLCSDGLTKHASDEEIAAELGRMESSEQLCHTLLDLALERGGKDNITVLAGRVRR
ncbi:MAG TPA: protein phosphatase 2C domain-containing protein [Gemmatimonadales bacterium]|nr:protein phosphatase 2C domain-containing protein [Gemmatimonadales bacterium]